MNSKIRISNSRETCRGGGILSNTPNWDELICWQMERNKCVDTKLVGVVIADFTSDAE